MKNEKYINDLKKRFPEDKYVIAEVPYVLVKSSNISFPKILVDTSNIEDQSKIKYFIVVFLKLNWTIENDLRNRSISFDALSYQYKFDFNKYCTMILRTLMISIFDPETKKETLMKDEIIKNLNSKLFDGIIHYFFEVQPHQHDMTDEEQRLLSMELHKYFTYKRNLNNGLHVGSPPPCPSIIIEKNLSETTGWSLEYIRSLSKRDITALNILTTQQNTDSFRDTPESNKLYIKNEYGDMEEYTDIEQIKKKKRLYEIGDEERDESYYEEDIPNRQTEPIEEFSIDELNTKIQSKDDFLKNLFEKSNNENNKEN